MPNGLLGRYGKYKSQSTYGSKVSYVFRQRRSIPEYVHIGWVKTIHLTITIERLLIEAHFPKMKNGEVQYMRNDLNIREVCLDSLANCSHSSAS